MSTAPMTKLGQTHLNEFPRQIFLSPRCRVDSWQDFFVGQDFSRQTGNPTFKLPAFPILMRVVYFFSQIV
jgi:membrane protein insertase Oxa1/YidC/SpoIIIJ